MTGIKAIIFDWGGVLIDAQTKVQFPQSKEVLEYCKAKGYRLALVCIASKFEERKKQIAESNLNAFFEMTAVGPLKPEQIWDSSFKGKDDLYEQVMKHLKLPVSEVLVVDDRVVRGITYANEHGHPSVWIQNGKFAHELPTPSTGQPTHTIHSISELMGLV